jgi:hypothetical protein
MSEYVASSYTNMLGRLLSRKAPEGQGGHLEGDTEDVTQAITRLDTAMYAFLAREIADTIGADGADTLLREAVRGFGRYRGNEIRRDVESRGLPLDVQRLLEYWDLPSLQESWDMQHKDRSPHYEGYDLPGCPFHDYLRHLCPQQYAVLMCEEVHVAVAKEFNPETDVWYPSLLTRGQDRCLFRFSMTLDAAESAAHQAERLRQEAKEEGRTLKGQKVSGMTDPATAYRMMARLFCLFYHSLVNELLRALGQDQTEDIVRRAMRKWGAWRGSDMAQDHEARGWPLNVENFVRYYDDLSAGDAWLAENVTLTPKAHSKDIIKSACADFFDRLGTGRFAAMLWEEALPAQASAYNPKISVSIPSLLERGDDVTTIRYSMAD